MTRGKWQNVVTRDGDAYIGTVMRTSGGSRVDVQRCPHKHPTWAEARECAARMEAERR